MTRVLLVDDHEVVRQGRRTMLEDQDNIEVVASAGTAADGIEHARTFEPDVVMDVRLPDGNGVEALDVDHVTGPGGRPTSTTALPTV